MKTVATALLGAAIALTSMNAASAAVSVLYRNDYNVGTDQMAAALADPAYVVTATSGDLSSFNLGDYDIVVYANQNLPAPAGDIAALDAHAASGGKLIFQNWTVFDPSSMPAGAGVTYGGATNFSFLTVGALFGAGITNPLSVVNPGWGIYSMNLTLTGASSQGVWEDSSVGISLFNNTIVNGFLTDTLDSSQLYANELAYLSGTSAGVPEPATWALMIVGFAGAGATLRRRRAYAAA